MGSKNVNLYSSSTVYCPPVDNCNITKGAQINILTDNISFQFANATGNKSLYLDAIEYHDATTGIFRFQTFINQSCKYAISSCNICNNNLSKIASEVESLNKPALIFFRKKIF